MEQDRQRYEVTVGGGYVTWVWAFSLDQATDWAVKRYGHITKDIAVKGPLTPED
jgi:hypothetical protein